jgi:hypothetical protein
MEKDEEIVMLNKNLQERVNNLEKINETIKRDMEEIKLENMKMKTLMNEL